ncbi:MAG: hypothetical protein HYS27_03385 [Deltaproteobacteria bacterium]|nr:hypothetical protein [Deltaproteobacteria bacterium]
MDSKMPVVDEPLRLRTPLHCWHESLVSARTDPLVALSTDGAFIATDRPVPVGTPLFLELSDEGRPAGAEVDAVAIAGAGPAPGFAVRFVALDDEARRFIAERLVEAERAAEPGATVVPREAFDEEATLPPPPARPTVQVAPIELSFDDATATPLSPEDLAPVVPEAQAPERYDAIELAEPALGDGTGAVPEPVAAATAADEETTAPEPPGRLFDEALALARGVELELEPPAMAAMPPPAQPAPAAPAPVPETEQTIRWARAPLVAPTVAPAGSVKNPFASGDSGSQPMFAAREQTERFAPVVPRAAAETPLSPAPPRAATPARSFLDEGPERIERTERWIRPTLPSAPTPAPVRSEIDETRPWTRANLVAATPAPAPAAAPPAASPTQPLRVRTPPAAATAPLPGPTLGAVESGAVPRAPMPRIASMEVPGNAPMPAIEQTQRWPTARVRVANAPLELPVGDVPFARPPEMQEQADVGPGLDVLFGDDDEPAGGDANDAPFVGAALGSVEPAFSTPLVGRRLEVEPALEAPIEMDESFEPEPMPAPAAPRAPSLDDTLPLAAPRAPSLDDTLPLPAAPARVPAAAAAGPFVAFAPNDETAPLPPAPSAPEVPFGASGGLLGAADDEMAFGGNASDLFGAAEVTDPGTSSAVPVTAEDGFEAPDDIGPTLETAEPIEVGEPLELTSVDDEEPMPAPDAAVAPATPGPPPPAALVAPAFALGDAEAIVTAEIPAETQQALLQAALSRPAEPAAMAPPARAPTAPVRTDPFFDQPATSEPPTAPVRREPKPTETQPYFTLGGAVRSLPPLPPPPASMTRAPPLPGRATPATSPSPTPAAPPSPATPNSAGPQRTDPYFPRWSDAAGPTPPPQNPFAGLQPIVPAAAAAPLLGNTLPAPVASASAPGGDTFFDDLAFEVAEQKHAAVPPPADQWQVEGQPQAEELPTVVGEDLPTVVGRAATPSTANPWLVGEPAKKS